jgi:hypothetical protein
MPQFKLVKEEFNSVYQEWQWTYLLAFAFTLNFRLITKITITDHTWRKPGREWITKELILNILTQLNNHLVEPTDYRGKRKAFVEEIFYDDRPYLVVFWWEDNHEDWLWVMNCYTVD